MSKKFRLLRQQYKEQANKGSAMVVVIIAMAFIGILASVLMYMSLLNYQMKVNNLKAKDNFYSAETVLDEIRVGMQEDVSASIGDAYQNILLNYATSTMDEKQVQLRYEFLSKMQESYGIEQSANVYVPDIYTPVKMLSFLSDEVAERTRLTVTYAIDDTHQVEYGMHREADGTVVGGRTTDGVLRPEDARTIWDPSVGAIDASLSLDEIPHGNMKLYTDGLAYCNLKVTYTDASGYVSVIQTDLRVKMPDMEFAQSVSLPALTSFSLIANNTLQVLPTNVNDVTNNEIAGSFFAKQLIVGSKVTGEGENVKLALQEVDEDSADEGKRMVVAEDLYLGEGTGLTADNYGELWTGSISMHGSAANGSTSEIDFAGSNVYVAGDLTITGDKNSFKAGTLAGEEYTGRYIGFGDGQDGTESSAIVVNGTETELDLSKLKNLSLAGNTYIALSSAQDLLDDSDFYRNSTENRKDILMGQSIAVKSDQLAYLVPAECIGIQDGKSVLSQVSNPVTLEQYRDLINKEGVTKVGLNIACDTLGGNDLAHYGIAEGNIQTYFKRVNSKITLVYFYVAFDKDSDVDREHANQYFQDYYRVNKDTMDAYAKLYTNNIQIRDQAAGAYIMHLAGNVVQTTEDGKSRQIHNATLSSDEANSGYQALLAVDRTKFQALCKKMIDVYEQLGSSEKDNDIFTNLVEKGTIQGYLGAVNGSMTLTPAQKAEAIYFGEADAEDKAVIVNSDYNYTGTGADKFNGLIIATGNVTVSKDFKGTILAGGNITLLKDVKVQPDREAVLHALTYSAEVDDVEYHVTDFLKGGEGYLRGDSKVYMDSEIRLGDLIVYENWQKQ